MVIKNINLETVCGITSKLPENEKPEIAFAGKSNVGKSSLINALMNRKSYARISATPGKTQTINFIISTRNFIWWICRDTDMRRFPKRKDPVGKSDRAVSAYIKTVESSLSSDRHPA